MPYRLQDFGSFHIGGREVQVSGQPRQTLAITPSVSLDHDPNGRFIVEPLYVQYFIPEEPVIDCPVVLLHGGGLTGACWETTPDGRPGWLQHFVGAGLPVYVIDNVERGRSGFCALPGEWPEPPVHRSEREAWWLFRFGADADFSARKPFPGQRFPLEAMDSFMRSFVPRWTMNGEAQQRAVAQALERIGPCVLICHSQGGDCGSRAAMRAPDSIRAAVMLEGSGFPEAIEDRAVRGKPWLFVLGDFIERSPRWRVMSGATAAAVDRINAAGGQAELVRLPEAGFPGATHMMMMDRHSAAIADWLIAWIRRAAAGRP